jgi:hypothetical protein
MNAQASQVFAPSIAGGVHLYQIAVGRWRMDGSHLTIEIVREETFIDGRPRVRWRVIGGERELAPWTRLEDALAHAFALSVGHSSI